MLVYKTVSRIWRPISKRRFLQYKVSEVIDSLQITRTQLAALGIVSRNDYNCNVSGLGPEIIKGLQGTGEVCRHYIITFQDTKA